MQMLQISLVWSDVSDSGRPPGSVHEEFNLHAHHASFIRQEFLLSLVLIAHSLSILFIFSGPDTILCG